MLRKSRLRQKMVFLLKKKNVYIAFLSFLCSEAAVNRFSLENTVLKNFEKFKEKRPFL